MTSVSMGKQLVWENTSLGQYGFSPNRNHAFSVLTSCDVIPSQQCIRLNVNDKNINERNKRIHLKSFCLSGLSCINHNKSNLESKAAGNCIFCSAVFFGLYLPYAGLAAASIDTLAFKVVIIPA